MRIFLTGSNGFIGSAIVPELINAGHQVLGLTRSDAGVQSLIAAGAEPHRGDLRDLDTLRSGAAQSDAVIHTAFIHDGGFAKFKENCEIDQRAIQALGSVLAGSNRPFIVTAGIGPLSPGRLATEEMNPRADSPLPRVSEQAAFELIPQGVRASVMRLPQVHDTVKQGLVTYLVALAREKGVSAYIDNGSNRWAAAHVLDVARLYRLALEEQASAGSDTPLKYHAVGEEGVPLRDIAEAIGQGLKLPVVSLSREQAATHFGFLALFAGVDMPASSAQTQQRLGWHPNGPGLLADLENMRYSEA